MLSRVTARNVGDVFFETHCSIIALIITVIMDLIPAIFWFIKRTFCIGRVTKLSSTIFSGYFDTLKMCSSFKRTVLTLLAFW